MLKSADSELSFFLENNAANYSAFLFKELWPQDLRQGNYRIIVLPFPRFSTGVAVSWRLGCLIVCFSSFGGAGRCMSGRRWTRHERSISAYYLCLQGESRVRLWATLTYLLQSVVTVPAMTNAKMQVQTDQKYVQAKKYMIGWLIRWLYKKH